MIAGLDGLFLGEALGGVLRPRVVGQRGAVVPGLAGLDGGFQTGIAGRIEHVVPALKVILAGCVEHGVPALKMLKLGLVMMVTLGYVQFGLIHPHAEPASGYPKRRTPSHGLDLGNGAQAMLGMRLIANVRHDSLQPVVPTCSGD
jgi:hypothetical protein